jgi:phosphoserine aminotransferase
MQVLRKNLGCAGITLVIIKNEWLGRSKRPKSKMWDYSIYAKNNSLYNTPPVFYYLYLFANITLVEKNLVV